MEAKILGQILGTAEGWDQADDWAIQFYKFTPSNGVKIPICDTLFISFDTGFVCAFDVEGKEMFTGHINFTIS